MDHDHFPVAVERQRALAHAAPGASRAHTESVVSPSQIWAMLWAHRVKTMLIAGSVILLTVAAAVLMPRTYEAEATVMVDFDVYDPLGDREFPMGMLGSYMATQVELAQGSSVVLTVVDRLGLTEVEDYTAGYSGDPAGLKEWVAERLRERLRIWQGGQGSQLIYINYKAKTADEAAQVANAVAEVYVDQQFDRQTGPASERARRYTDQIDQLKAKVDEAQGDVAAFRQRSGLIDAEMAGNVSVELLTALEHRLQEVQQMRRVAAAKAASDQSVDSAVLGSTMVQSLKTRLSDLDARMADLRATHGARHPEVQALQAQIGVTRRAMEAEQSAYSRNAQGELTAARTLERQLQEAVEEQRAKVAVVRNHQDEAAKLGLELASAKEVYQRALEGYDQVLFAAAGGYSNVELISRASPPPRASEPRVFVLLFMGIVGGLMLGIILPLLQELLHRRIRCRDDIERDHGLPVLAELSSFRGNGGAWELQHGG